MKQERTKKSKLWLWLVIGAAAVLAVAGVVLAIVLGGGTGGNQDPTGPVGGRPDLYWNVDRETYMSNSTTEGISTRQPAEDGNYYIRFAHNGQQVDLQIADKRLVNFIDNMDLMGLQMDADGVVIAALDPAEVAVEVGKSIFIQKVEGDKIIANSSIGMNGMKIEIEISDLLQIYNVSDTAEVIGEIVDPADLQPFDGISVYANDKEEETHVYIVSQPEPTKLYWRATQSYDSANKCTGRTPDENGVYTVPFFCEGERIELKCKDKDIVTAIDYRSRWCPDFGFRFDEEGYIVASIPPAEGQRMVRAARRVDITAIDGNVITAENLGNFDGGVASYTFTLPEDCVIYDASLKAKGEGNQGKPTDSLQLGDRITVWTDANGNAKVIYVAMRLVDSPIYYNINRMYASGTTRTPNAQGYYEIDVMVEGELKTLKCNKKEVVDYLDSYSYKLFTAKVENDIIEYAYIYECAYGGTYLCNNYTVTTVTGIVFSAESATGATVVNGIMNPECKVYDVSGVSGPIGTETKLQLGDKIIAPRNATGEVMRVYVISRAKEGYCSHCKQNVKWQSYNGGSIAYADGHYYLSGNVNQGIQIVVGYDNREYEVVLDLNGYTLSRTDEGGRVAVAYKGDTLTIMDSKGGGKIKGTGKTNLSGSVLLANNGTINLMGGEVTLVDSKQCNPRGGVVMLSGSESVFNMYGGTITGGVAKPTQKYPTTAGGNVWNYKGIFNMYGGTISNGTANRGGNVYIATGAKFNMSGGTITGGNVEDRAGNIYIGTDCVANITGGTITKGTAGRAGGNIGIYGNGKVSITGVKITDGVAKFNEKNKDAFGGNIYLYTGELNINKAEVLNGKSEFYGGNLYLYAGTVNITDSKISGGSAAKYAGNIYTVGKDNKEFDGLKLTLTNTTVADGTGTRGGNMYISGTTVLDMEKSTITGGKAERGGNLYLGGKAEVNLKNGKIIDGVATRFGGNVGIFSENVHMNVSGGEIANGYVDGSTKNEDAYGGNIYLYSGHLNVSGGKIVGGKCNTEIAKTSAGGNIYGYGDVILDDNKKEIGIYDASITISGGEISGGSAKTSGNLLIRSKDYIDITISGGIIDGDSAINGAKSFTISGNPQISKNAGGLKIGTLATLGKMTKDAKIYVSADGIFTTSTKNAESYLPYFAPAISSKSIVVKDGALAVVSLDAATGNGIYAKAVKMTFTGKVDTKTCPVCNEEVQWTPITNKTAQKLADASYKGCTHFYLAEDIVLDGNGQILASGGQYCLNLNGHSITQTGKPSDPTAKLINKSAICISAGADLNIMGNGKVSGRGSGWTDTETNINWKAGGALQVRGNVNLFGGTYMTSTGRDMPAVSTFYNKNATINVYAGTAIKGNVDSPVKEFTGCVYILSADHNFNMFGGSVIGGRATNGGNIRIDAGNILLAGGTIDGAVYAGEKAKVTLSGAVKIENRAGGLDLTSGAKITIDALASGADVTVKLAKSGDFTNALSDAQAKIALKSIKGAAANITIKQNKSTKALTATVSQQTDDPMNAVYDKAVQMTTDKVFETKADANGNVVGKCPACGIEVTWKPLPVMTESTTDFTALAGGHYYLDSDVDYTQAKGRGYHVPASKNVCVHLNGQTLSAASGGPKTRMFWVDVTGTLSIMGDGTVIGEGDGGKPEARRGGVADVNSGTLNLYGGTYAVTGTAPAIGSRCTYSGTKGTPAGKINVYAGTKITGMVSLNPIYNNTTKEQGKTEFTVFGGELTGGVYVGEFAEVTLMYKVKVSNFKGGLDLTSGAKITLDTLTDGAEIYVTPNDGVEFTTAIDAKLANKVLNYVKGAKNATTTVEVKLNKASMALYAKVTSKQVVAPTTQEIIAGAKDQAFTSKFDGQTGEVKATCPHCGYEVTWTPISSATTNKVLTATNAETNQGHYYLAESFTNAESYFTAGDSNTMSGSEFCLFLNGKTLTNDGVRGIWIPYGYTLNVMGEDGGITGTGSNSAADKAVASDRGSAFDTVGSLNIYGGTYSNTDKCAIISVRSYGSNIVNIYGGTISGTQARPNIMISADAEVNMEGGLITNSSTVKENGLNLRISKKNAVFTMTGGEISLPDGIAGTSGGNIIVTTGTLKVEKDAVITNGTAANGGNIYATGVNAKILISGGTISNGTATGGGGNIYVAAGATLEMTGGTVTGGHAVGQGGNFFVKGELENRSTVTFGEGAVISNGVSDGTTGGGNLYISSYSDVTLNKAEIKDGTAPNGFGGNICLNSTVSTLTFTDATVSNGSVYVKSGEKLTVSGGTIDGGLEVAVATQFTLSGDVKITAANGGLDLTNGKIIDVNGLGQNAEIFVTANDGVDFTTAVDATLATNVLNYVKAAASNAEVKLNTTTGALYAEVEAPAVVPLDQVYSTAVQMTTDGIFNAGGNVTTTCPYCNEVVTWKPLPVMGTSGLVDSNGFTALTSGHYYLDANTDYTQCAGSGYKVGGNVSACLHLNGQTIAPAATDTTVRTFWVDVRGAMTVMGDGTVSGNGRGTSAADFRGAAFDVNSGTLNLFGGTYTSTGATPAINARCAYNGDNGPTGKVNIYNGTNVQGWVSLNAGANGRTLFKMFGGQLSGGAVANLRTEITLSGDTKIADVNGGLDVTSGTIIDVSGLTQNAEIFVTANDGADFTTAMDATLAANVLNYVKGATVTGSTITVSVNTTTNALTATVTASGGGEGGSGDSGDDEGGNDDQTRTPEEIIAAAKDQTFTSLFATATEGVTATCPHCGVEVEWKPLPVISGANQLMTDSTHYYLATGTDYTDNGTGTGNYYYQNANGQSTCLFLNGKTLTDVKGRAFLIAKGTFNLMGEGAIVGNGSGEGDSGWRGAFDIGCGADGQDVIVNIYGGTIKSTSAVPAMTYRLHRKNTVNLYGGTIGSSTQTGHGVNFNADTTSNSVLNVAGGTIYGGAGSAILVNGTAQVNISAGTINSGAITGGGLYVKKAATVTMTGGKIIAGTTAAGNGVNVRLGEGAKFTMTGGEVSMAEGVTGTSGGNFFVYKAELEIGGTALIKDGNSTANGGNIYASGEGAKVTVTGGTISGGTAAGNGGNIFATDKVVVNITGATVTEGTAEGGGNIYVEAGTGLTIDNSAITLGEATGNGGNMFIKSASSIKDFAISNTEISGGVAKGTTGGGNLYASSYTNITLTNVEVKDGTAPNANGGNICMNSTAATVQLVDSTVTNGDIYAKSARKLVINNSTIDGGVKIVATQQTAELSGKVVIAATNGGLDLTNVQTISLIDLTEDSSIYVTANDGVIADTENAATYADCFTTVDGKDVTADGNTLVYGDVQQSLLMAIARFLNVV